MNNKELPVNCAHQLRLGRMLEAEMKKNLTAKLGRHEAHLMR